jgi:hypothetical protein
MSKRPRLNDKSASGAARPNLQGTDGRRAISKSRGHGVVTADAPPDALFTTGRTVGAGDDARESSRQPASDRQTPAPPNMAGGLGAFPGAALDEVCRQQSELESLAFRVRALEASVDGSGERSASVHVMRGELLAIRDAVAADHARFATRTVELTFELAYFRDEAERLRADKVELLAYSSDVENRLVARERQAESYWRETEARIAALELRLISARSANLRAYLADGRSLATTRLRDLRIVVWQRRARWRSKR